MQKDGSKRFWLFECIMVVTGGVMACVYYFTQSTALPLLLCLLVSVVGTVVGSIIVWEREKQLGDLSVLVTKLWLSHNVASAILLAFVLGGDVMYILFFLIVWVPLSLPVFAGAGLVIKWVIYK